MGELFGARLIQNLRGGNCVVDHTCSGHAVCCHSVGSDSSGPQFCCNCASVSYDFQMLTVSDCSLKTHLAYAVVVRVFL